MIVRRGDGESTVEVIDSGHGIPEDQRGRVSRKFYRAGGRDSVGESGGDFEGSGLGARDRQACSGSPFRQNRLRGRQRRYWSKRYRAIA